MLEKAAGGIQGRTRDYISEQAGEADLIQVWDFALTPGRLCVGGRPTWYCVNMDAEQSSLLELCNAPCVAGSEEGEWASVARWGWVRSMTRPKAERQLTDDDR